MSSQKKVLNLRIKPDYFLNPYAKYFNGTALENIVYGGGSSGKSYAILDMVVFWTLRGQNTIITRKTANTIRKSVFFEIVKSIKRHNLERYFDVSVANAIITCKINKGAIVFVGLDDTEKIKSITPPKADAFDTLVMEEASESTEDDYNQLCIRMRGKTKFKKRRFLILNPILKKHWIYKRFFQPLEGKVDINRLSWSYEAKDLSITKTTYRDNIYLEDEERRTLEDMKHHSRYHYEVYSNGNWGVLGKKVLPNYEVVDFSLEDLYVPGMSHNIGIDFGFSVDPSAIVHTAYNEAKRELYIYAEKKQSAMWEEQMKTYLQTYRENHRIPDPITYADNEPRTIARLGKLGVYANAVKKNEVLTDIYWLQQQKIIIHPSCTQMKDEIEELVYKKDKLGEYMNELDDKRREGHHFDLIAALRYSQNDHITGQKYIGYTGRI